MRPLRVRRQGRRTAPIAPALVLTPRVWVCQTALLRDTGLAPSSTPGPALGVATGVLLCERRSSCHPLVSGALKKISLLEGPVRLKKKARGIVNTTRSRESRTITVFRSSLDANSRIGIEKTRCVVRTIQWGLFKQQARQTRHKSESVCPSSATSTLMCSPAGEAGTTLEPEQLARPCLTCPSTERAPSHRPEELLWCRSGRGT